MAWNSSGIPRLSPRFENNNDDDTNIPKITGASTLFVLLHMPTNKAKNISPQTILMANVFAVVGNNHAYGSNIAGIINNALYRDSVKLEILDPNVVIVNGVYGKVVNDMVFPHPVESHAVA